MMNQDSPILVRFLLFAFFIAATISHFAFPEVAVAQFPPDKVSVLPVFVVPKGQQKPSKSEKVLLMKHVQWAQKRYREMLGNRSTFDFKIKPKVFESKRTLKQFEKGKPANLIVEELLDFYQTDRFSCKYIFLTVFVNPKTKFPSPGGRPINGGVNTGGGIVVFSSLALTTSKKFQTVLQHELGHSFGLPHVDTYGYQQKQNQSIMSYNRAHHTNGLRPSKTPGILIPEDIRSLALNDRVFAGLKFDEKRDVPRGYKLKGVRILGTMELPQHPLVQVKTSDGETKNTSVDNIVHSRIKPSIDRGKIEFDRKTMWQSGPLDDGVASVRLTFPMKVALDRIKVYSQHSGQHHGVKSVRVSTVNKNQETIVVVESKIQVPDGEVKFKQATSKRWKIDFRAGKSKKVVIRGLRFFNGDQEMFPPSVPYKAER